MAAEHMDRSLGRASRTTSLHALPSLTGSSAAAQRSDYPAAAAPLVAGGGTTAELARADPRRVAGSAGVNWAAVREAATVVSGPRPTHRQVART